jgi:hypothetical protein
VSLLWRDRLLVSLAPTAVSWVRLHGRFKTRAVDKGSIDTDPAYGREPWAGAIAALRVQAAAWQRERLDVTVVLSNHFVRYALLEASVRGVTRDEELALARFHFTRLHGERAAAWDVRVATTDRRSPRVASAIDRPLVEALKSAFAPDGRPKLKSIQPYLVCAFNRWRGSIGKHGAWLVLVEPGRVCLAMLSGRAWSVLQSVRSPADTPPDWLALVEREKQRAPVQPVPPTVLARTAIRAEREPQSRGAWNVIMLEAPAVAGVAADERESYAMALHAA